MNLTNNLTKGFLTGSGQWVNNGRGADDSLNRWSNWEDPTYMGFYFNINEFGYYDPNNLDMDVLPQGLFMPYDVGANAASGSTSNPAGGSSGYLNLPDSAESFLRRRGEYYRAGMISEFRKGFLSVIRKEPWVFEKVTGIEALWKAEPNQPYRAKGKQIVFDCHENLSMKMTYLIDCYRKASFDYINMRHSLPDNQRFFSMDLWVTEIRFLKRPDASGNATFFNTGSFIRFRLDYCEFDFLNTDTLGYTSDLARFASDKPASVKIPINIGSIREVNNYGLLGGFLTDTQYAWQRGKDSLNKSFTQDTTIKDGTGEYVSLANSNLTAIEENNNYGFPDPRSKKSSAAVDPNTDLGATEWVEQRALFSKAGLKDDEFSFGVGNPNKGTPNQRPGSTSLEGQENNDSLAGQKVPLSGAAPTSTDLSAAGANLEGAPVNLVGADLGNVDVGSRARGLASNLLRAAFLGNVYGFSLTTLVGQIQGILNNPVAALQGIFSRFAKSPEEAATLADNVQLSSADVSLLKSFIGDIKDIQSVTAGTSLENATLGELTRLEPPKQTTPNPAKQTLSSSGKPSLLQSDLGKILFGASPVAAQATAKVPLSGPDSTINADIDPVVEPLEGADGNQSKELGSTELDNNGTRLQGDTLGNIGFPGIRKDNDSRRVSQ